MAHIFMRFIVEAAVTFAILFAGIGYISPKPKREDPLPHDWKKEIR